MSKAVGPHGKVIAFEAQPELAQHLNELKSAFNLTSVTFENMGLSSSPGTMSLFRDEVGPGDASFHNKTSKSQSVEVKVTTLDEYYQHSMPIKFIKCDVEWHELEVFKGAKRLSTDKPILLFECHHNEADKGDIFSFLTGLGYDGFFLHRSDLIHYSKFREFLYRKESESHRNYIFF